MSCDPHVTPHNHHHRHRHHHHHHQDHHYSHSTVTLVIKVMDTITVNIVSSSLPLSSPSPVSHLHTIEMHRVLHSHRVMTASSVPTHQMSNWRRRGGWTDVWRRCHVLLAHIDVHAHTLAYTLMHAHTCTHTYIYATTFTHTHTQTHTHTHTHTHRHKRLLVALHNYVTYILWSRTNYTLMECQSVPDPHTLNWHVLVSPAMCHIKYLLSSWSQMPVLLWSGPTSYRWNKHDLPHHRMGVGATA